MWEFSLYFEKNLLPYFHALKSKLKMLCKKCHNCIAIGIKNEEYVFMVALNQESYNKNIGYIKQKIAEIICIYYKPLHILKSIKNFDIKNQNNVLLLDILSSYDYEQDINFIISNLSLIDKLYLKSFVNFKLSEQLGKWSEIGELINENSLFLLDEKVRVELTKFLMSGITSKHDKLTLKLEQNGVAIFDKDNQQLDCNKIFYAQSHYDNILFALINQCPSNIEIMDYTKFDVQFLDSLHKVFGKKVKLLK